MHGGHLEHWLPVEKTPDDDDALFYNVLNKVDDGSVKIATFHMILKSKE